MPKTNTLAQSNAHNAIFYSTAALLFSTSAFLLYQTGKAYVNHRNTQLAAETNATPTAKVNLVLSKITAMLPSPRFWR